MNEGKKEYRAELPFHIYTRTRETVCPLHSFRILIYIYGVRHWFGFWRAGVMTTNDRDWIRTWMGWDSGMVHFTDRGVGIVLALLS